MRWDQDINTKLSMIVGARVEHTKIDYTGNYVMDEEDLEGSVQHKNNYTNVLPSLSFKYNVDETFILRTALQQP
ncbi:outer membrane beta-barrel family protein [Sphingobacterium sp. KU25419]|nr:outer membrane beta-barrel family protein [Sphingobacterium sp. KU25419]